MEKATEKQSIREYGSRKRRNRIIRIIAFTSLLLILLTVGTVYVYRLYHRTYSSYEVLATTPNTEENLSGYLNYNGSILRYGKDGAVAFDKKGKLLWNGAYEMQSPIAASSGKFAVIADKGDKAVRVFDGNGKMTSLTMEKDILQAEVAYQGVSAILMGDEEAHYVNLYDFQGNTIIEKKYPISKDGYPMDITLSEDGQKLGMIFMSVNKGKLINKVALYNFGEVGKNLKDRLGGGYIFEDEMIIPRLSFLDNDTVCVYKDNGFILYSMPELPVLVTEVNVEGRIKSILHSPKYTGLVLDDGGDMPRLLLYNLSGKPILNKKISLDYQNIFISEDEIILYDNLTCQIIKSDGTEKFKYSFNTNISAFAPLNHLDKYLMINSAEVMEIKLIE